jgi:aldehyde:ferredoxin oxidoreductase
LLTDCLTMCKNIGLCMDVLNFETACHLIRAGTGVTYSPDELEEKLGKCIERDYQLNLRFGVTPKDDTLPRRMRREPLQKAGPATDQVVGNLAHLLDEYYQALGYTAQGIPGIERLQELDLPEAVKNIKTHPATNSSDSPDKSA